MTRPSFLQRLFGKAAPAPAPPPTAPPAVAAAPSVLSDNAAKEIFDTLGAPAFHIKTLGAKAAIHSWQIEITLEELKERLAQNDISATLASILAQTVEIFENVQDLNTWRSNAYTLAYTHKVLPHAPSHIQHILSIGCPLSMKGAPRYTMQLDKTVRTLSRDTAWMHERREGSVVMLKPIPPEFHAPARAFFEHIQARSAPELTRNAHKKIALGGVYGPQGDL